MDKIIKLLRRINKKDRERLLELINKLLSGKLENLHIKKLKGGKVYRIRSGKFRVIFKLNNKYIEITDIRYRDENTYK
ncbi:MAG: type II toxin-antitoxin system RelE/ParE family toxin [Patescibacteria group bacterium]|nr:type II toxin-antitoxin system RelE/ParE family toxin [Patescibacteria group bacterium]MBU2509423.1 type II toxin-antitoxin system RelE/ParE family toxin [Patescibacteria group bacterium]